MKSSKAPYGKGKGTRDASAFAFDQQFWESRAASLAEHAALTGYADRFIRLMDVSPDWTVLDMGCGGGTLAIPLSERVKEVTAVDFARSMIGIVEDTCRTGNIGNVRAMVGSWEDDWAALGIGEHDVAIASRSILPKDVPGCIRKLESVARRRVYVSTIVDDGPVDTRLLAFAGRKRPPTPDYVDYYLMLYDMGIRANCVLIAESHANAWATFEEAFEGQRWMFHDMTAREEKKVREYLEEKLETRDGMLRLPYSRDCQWAVMWWDRQTR